MPTLHALDVLESAPDWERCPFLVIFGDELFLRRQMIDAVRGHAERASGLPASLVDGDAAGWADVMDEVSTRSLFADDSRRFAIVDPADKFVSAHRERLEDQVRLTEAQGCLVLVVGAWASNTRLYKAVDQSALQIDCRLPNRGSGKQIDELRVRDWIVGWAQRRHALAIAPDAALELFETTGHALGMIDQDLAKLSLLGGTERKVDLDTVRRVIGGWRQKTVWDIIDAALDGETAEALSQLDHLLASGEAAIAIFAQISFVLRRYASVADRLARNGRTRQRESIGDALLACGFKDWPKGTLKGAERRLGRLGKGRATILHRWLIETDVALKGTHAAPDRARFALERLFLRLGAATTT